MIRGGKHAARPFRCRLPCRCVPDPWVQRSCFPGLPICFRKPILPRSVSASRFPRKILSVYLLISDVTRRGRCRSGSRGKLASTCSPCRTSRRWSVFSMNFLPNPFWSESAVFLCPWRAFRRSCRCLVMGVAIFQFRWTGRHPRIFSSRIRNALRGAWRTKLFACRLRVPAAWMPQRRRSE
ncbi:hypothetical protein D3C87_1273820 [compost metagenome]